MSAHEDSLQDRRRLDASSPPPWPRPRESEGRNTSPGSRAVSLALCHVGRCVMPTAFDQWEISPLDQTRRLAMKGRRPHPGPPLPRAQRAHSRAIAGLESTRQLRPTWVFQRHAPDRSGCDPLQSLPRVGASRRRWLHRLGPRPGISTPTSPSRTGRIGPSVRSRHRDCRRRASRGSPRHRDPARARE